MKKYDLIISLGGSCGTSLQLRKRGLQFQSFPFDWLFHINKKQIKALTKGFENDFKNWLKYDNLKRLSKKEQGDSKTYQYKDLQTNFRYIHDFEKPKYFYKEYDKVKEKYIRRQKRLIEYIKKSKKVLFIIDTNYHINEKLLINFIKSLNYKFKRKKFNLICLYFLNKKNYINNINSNIRVYEIDRARNKDDYYKSNIKEWNFLDNLILSNKGLHLQKQFKIKEFKIKSLIKFLKLKTIKFRYKIKEFFLKTIS